MSSSEYEFVDNDQRVDDDERYCECWYQHHDMHKASVRNVLLIKVRTDAIRLMTFDLTLVLSGGPPKAGSCCTDPQPTAHVLLVARTRMWVWVQRKRTSGEKAVFGKDGYCVDQQYRDCEETCVSFGCAPIESHDMLP